MSYRPWPARSKVLARFSDDRIYRYRLECVWDVGSEFWTFIMLNPSTADERFSDPTVSRCVNRAMDAGAGGIIVVNLFALRATDPKEMRAHPRPIEGKDGENDWHIANAAERCSKVIVAWGTHGAFRAPGRDSSRNHEVMRLLENAGVQSYRIGAASAQGHPKHPLYLRSDEDLEVHRL
jgi:hypothetical protein